MKKLCIILLCISNAIVPASIDKTHEERIKFPDSNIILHTLESSLTEYQEEINFIYPPAEFPNIAEELANKTLTRDETKAIIAKNIFYLVPLCEASQDRMHLCDTLNRIHISQTLNYVLAVLSKYRIS